MSLPYPGGPDPAPPGPTAPDTAAPDTAAPVPPPASRTRADLRRAPLGGVTAARLDVATLAGWAREAGDEELVSLLSGLSDGWQDWSTPAPAAPPDADHPAAPLRAPGSTQPCQALDDAIAAGLVRPLPRRVRRRLWAVVRRARAGVFPVWKSDGTHARLILWPAGTNAHTRPVAACMPHTADAIAALVRGGATCAATIDARGFFNQFPLGDAAAAAFAFRGPSGEWLVPSVLPMGFKLSPALAQRVLLLLLHRAGLTEHSMVWIDNVLITAQCTKELDEALRRFEETAAMVGLDWVLEGKGRKVDYLGAELDFGASTFRFLPRLRDKLSALANTALSAPMTLAHFRSLVGTMVWVAHLSRTPLAHLSTTLNNLATASRLLAADALPDEYLQHCVCPADELDRVLSLARQEHRMAPPVLPTYDSSLYVDSSDLMAGSFLDPQGTMEQWLWQEPLAHINAKELSAIYHGLADLHLSDMTIPVYTDSMVCYHLLNRSYTRSRRLQPILASILHLCEQANLQLDVQWVATDSNPADYPSRVPLSSPEALLTRSVYP